jgi:mono/diheme cytochrome c family protein
MLLLRNSARTFSVVTLLLTGGAPQAADKVTPGQRIYDRDCATCHGPGGKGDGETATYLSPQPQDFTTGILQKRSDEFLATVIAKGGVAKNLSESMPAFPKLSKSDVQNVVAYIRQLATGGAKNPKSQGN